MACDYVDVTLTSVTSRVTITQTEKVTYTMKVRNIVDYFTTENGEKISFNVPMIVNSREGANDEKNIL